MQSTSFTTAPRPQVMSREEAYAGKMAQYAVDMAEFEASPCRQAAQIICCLAGTASLLGSAVALPLVSKLVGGQFAWNLTAGASAGCCAVSLLGMKIADMPNEPEHPDVRSDSGYAGGS